MELVLDRKLYSGDAVDATQEAFSPFARITRIDEDAATWRIRFAEIDPEFKDVIADEFANYALGLTAEGRHGS
ncbi:MAG: HxsD-like protein [Pseudomonadota bacterium]